MGLPGIVAENTEYIEAIQEMLEALASAIKESYALGMHRFKCKILWRDRPDIIYYEKDRLILEDIKHKMSSILCTVQR